MDYIFTRLEEECDVLGGNEEELAASRGRFNSGGRNVEGMDLGGHVSQVSPDLGRVERGRNKRSANYDRPSPQSRLMQQPPTGSVWPTLSHHASCQGRHGSR